MGRKVDVGHLVGATEIADRAGVERGVVHDWRRRYGPGPDQGQKTPHFPEPVARLSGVQKTPALVWYWPDVEQWLRDTGRLGGKRGKRGKARP